MSTAAASPAAQPAAPPPAVANPAGVSSLPPQQHQKHPDLWKGLPIEVICITGEPGSGKSLFALTIDPGPRTLCIDEEGSTTIYQPSLGFERHDLWEEMRRLHGDNSTALQRWKWLQEFAIEKGKSGNYTVLSIDTWSPFEGGIIDWVKSCPEKFGKSRAQLEGSTGLLFGTVKDAMSVFLNTLRPYFQTICLINHMRNEFAGPKPTGKREAKGKDTLMQIASLYLKMEKQKDSPIPAAIVYSDKNRLAIPVRNDDGTLAVDDYGDVRMTPLLPPRIPKCTPGNIRRYIDKPPNYAKLKPGEKIEEKQLSEDERLFLQVQIAADNATAAQAQLSQIEMMQQAALRQGGMGMAATAAPLPQATAAPLASQPAAHPAQQQQPQQQQIDANGQQLPAGQTTQLQIDPQAAAGAMSQSVNSRCTADQKAELQRIMVELQPDQEKLRATVAKLCERFNVAKIGELSVAQVDGLIQQLDAKLTERILVDGAEKPVQQQPPQQSTAGQAAASDSQPLQEQQQAEEKEEKPDTVPFKQDAPPSGPCTAEQRQKIGELAGKLNWAQEGQQKYLLKFGCSRWRDLSAKAADETITALEQKLATFPPATAKN